MAPAVALQRRVTLQQLGRYAGVTSYERYRTISAGAVETGNGVANEKADSLGAGSARCKAMGNW